MRALAISTVSANAVALMLTLAPVVTACGDDAPSATLPAMVAGPFARDLVLGADTRTSLPTPVPAIARDATGRFYWYCAEARGGTIVFELRAEVTALSPGAVIHRTEQSVGEQQVQGTLSVAPRDFSRGGVRRTESGPEWLEGTYSLHASVSGTDLASVVFEVR